MIQLTSKSTPLYLIPTPIGNLEDMTYRSVRVLQSCTTIFCEDTRVSSTLLRHYEIKAKLVSLHEHNELSRVEQIKACLDNNETIALITDAGMPTVSDPGFKIVEKLAEENYAVTALPGSSAFVCAIAMSGFDSSVFTFHGFFERKSSKATTDLTNLIGQQGLHIYYESPHRINQTLKLIQETLGDIKICIAREISKMYETIYRGNVSEFIDEEYRGELVLIIPPIQEVEKDLHTEVLNLINLDFTNKQIIEILKKAGFSKNEVYQKYLELTKK